MLTLFRYNYADLCTQGIFLADGVYSGDSLELPWKSNAEFVSCIPEGEYELVWKETGHEIGPCYEVQNVEGRTGILIHKANDVLELEGCIAPGEKYGETLWHSEKALNGLHSSCGNTVSLKIISAFKE